MRTVLRWTVAALAVSCVASAHAQRLYQWTDPAGQVHSTDDLNEVPQPWRGSYERQEAEQAARAAQQGPGETTPGGGSKTVREVAPGKIETVITPAPAAEKPVEESSDTGGKDYLQQYRDREKAKAASRAEWEQKTRDARKELSNLKKKKAELRILRRAANQRYLATATQNAKMERDKLREEHEAVKAAIAKQEAYLAEGIYEEARKAGVPPGWIRDTK